MTNEKTELTVLEAQQHFEQFLENHQSNNIQAPIGTPQNIREPLPRTPDWSKARVVDMSVGKAILAPLKYNTNLNVRVDDDVYLSLDSIAQLLIYQNKSGEKQVEVVVSIPNRYYLRSTNLNKSFIGKVIVTDWDGLFLDGYVYRKTGVSYLLDSKTVIDEVGSVPRRNPENGTRYGRSTPHDNNGSGAGGYYTQSRTDYYKCTGTDSRYPLMGNNTNYSVNNDGWDCSYSHSEYQREYHPYRDHHHSNYPKDDSHNSGEGGGGAVNGYPSENDYYTPANDNNHCGQPSDCRDYMPNDGDYHAEIVDRIREFIPDLSSTQIDALNSDIDLANRIDIHLNRKNNSETAIKVTKYHLDMWANDADYKEFVTQFDAAAINPILLELLKEMTFEFAFKMIKKYAPGFSDVDALKQAIGALKDGDWLDFLDATFDIIKKKVPAFVALDALIDSYKIGEKFYNTFHFYRKLEKLGSDKVELIYNTIKAKGDVLGKVFWKNNIEGAVAEGLNRLEIWEELKKQIRKKVSFDEVSETFTDNKGVIRTEYFFKEKGAKDNSVLGIKIKWYQEANTTKGPTISFEKNGHIVKIRFPN